MPCKLSPSSWKAGLPEAMSVEDGHDLIAGLKGSIQGCTPSLNPKEHHAGLVITLDWGLDLRVFE